MGNGEAMISPKRTSQAYEQGSHACRKTRGVPKLTVCPYQKFSAQNRAFSRAWNDVNRVAKKFWSKSHNARKYAY